VPDEEIACPQCTSEDLRGEPAAGGAIALTCESCGHRWQRSPAPVCSRCGTADPFVKRIEGWQYDDLEEARENTMASYDDVTYDEHRCRSCGHVWRVEVARKTGRGG
jgi:hypothetical protein